MLASLASLRHAAVGILAAVLADLPLPSAFAADFGDFLHYTVSFEGIGPVRFGMTIAEFRALPGPRFFLWNDDVGPECYYALTGRYPSQDKLDFRFVIVHRRVAALEVGNPGIRTDQGVGVGDTAEAVRRAYGGALVRKPIPGNKDIEHAYWLVLHKNDDMEALFTIRNERVVGYAFGSPGSVEAYDGCM